MLISVDRNPYAERAILFGPDGRPLSHFVGCAKKNSDTWLAKVRGEHPGVPVVASPLDRWPESLREDPDIRWLHPGLVKRLYGACQPWNLRRKLHRAFLFSYLLRHKVSALDAVAAVRDFELQTAYQIIDSNV